MPPETIVDVAMGHAELPIGHPSSTYAICSSNIDAQPARANPSGAKLFGRYPRHVNPNGNWAASFSGACQPLPAVVVGRAGNDWRNVDSGSHNATFMGANWCNSV
jgi:hypothetical protein